MTEYVIAVDFGGTKTRAARFDLSTEKLLQRAVRPTLRQGDADAVLGTVRDTVREVVDPAAKPSMIVVGSIGPLDIHHGTIVRAPMFANMAMVPLRGFLQEAFGVPVYALNDANLAAAGEFAYGAGRGSTDMILLTIGTGVGGGVVIGGQLLNGCRGYAGELGHLSVHPDGLLCGCGLRGCIEAHASGTAMESEALRLVRQGVSTALRSVVDANGVVRVQDIAACADAGDQPSLEILQRAARDLGIGLAGLVNVFNPDCVVVGGGVSNVEPFFHLLAAEIRRRAMPVLAEGLRIERSRLAGDAGLYGGLAIAARRVPWPLLRD